MNRNPTEVNPQQGKTKVMKHIRPLAVDTNSLPYAKLIP